VGSWRSDQMVGGFIECGIPNSFRCVYGKDARGQMSFANRLVLRLVLLITGRDCGTIV